MAFRYTAGIATSIADWFQRFQNWLPLVGWSVQQGGGTTDMVIRSLGEDRKNYSRLYARVWNVPATQNIRAEVRDDLAGTHQTNEAGILNAGAGNIQYWMSGDGEGISITFRNATPAWSHIFFGCCYPFAMRIPDETYKMIATSTIHAASILRNYDNTWDVDINVWEEVNCPSLRRCPADNSFSTMGLFANQQGYIAGQLPHISGQINDPNILTLQEITTWEEQTKRTTWIVLQDSAGLKFMQRTGGDRPVGFKESGNFAYTDGVCNNATDFIQNRLVAFLQAIGWQYLGDPGLHTVSGLFYSTGESGTDAIFVIVAWNNGANDYWHLYVQDDAAGTHRTDLNAFTLMDEANFPAKYWIAADRDCFVFSVDSGGYTNYPNWAGKVFASNRQLAGSPYHMGVWCPELNRVRLLRDHAGNWSQDGAVLDAGVRLTASSPNRFDDRTYVLWPVMLADPLPGGGYDPVGLVKYVYRLDGAVCPGDTIRCVDREHRVFRSVPAAGATWAMRTA